MTVTRTPLPMIIGEVEAVAVQRLSPSFVRVELGGALLADFGVDGPLLDQRIKMIFPGASGRPPSFEGAEESWYAAWLDRPADERGHLRTYTVRAVRGSGPDTRLTVDFVLHPAPPGGVEGPGSSWAASAAPGDRVGVVAPRRGVSFGGIEWAPGAATSLLIAADETAVPAASGILEDLPDGTVGTAFLEVPVSGDVLDVHPPVGTEVVWLPRQGAAHGERLHQAVVEHLSAEIGTAPFEEPAAVAPDLWETPGYSSSGETVSESAQPHEGLYAWIAGEAGVVTALRRHLVRERGMDRRQVAFMGYWRRGVAMRS